jgi:signal transduction histidine kinase
VITRESHGPITNQLTQICSNLVDEQRRIREFVEMNRSNQSDDTAGIVLADELQSSFFRLQQQWSFNGNVTVSPPDLIVSPILARHVRHLMMEAVSNAVRHGKASRINIFAQQDLGGFLQVDIHDNGKGFEKLDGGYDDATVSTLDKGPRSLRARVKELGGSLDLETFPSGSRLKVQVPLR